MKWPGLLLLLFFATVSFSQTPLVSPVVLTHLSEENGLSDNRVTAIFKDKEDLLWIGTKDGLNLLNGSTVRIFKNDPADSNSLLQNTITDITEDSAGRIWVAGTDGFGYYDKKQRKFFNNKYLQPGRVPTGGIGSVAVDPKGIIWLASGGGLIEYDPENKKGILHVNNAGAGIDADRFNNHLNKAIIGSDGLIWLATANGLWSYSVAEGFKEIIHKEKDRSFPLCLTVYEDHRHHIWAGFWNTGVKEYIPASHTLVEEPIGGQPISTVSAILEMRDNNGNDILWLNGPLTAFNFTHPGFRNYPIPVGENDFPEVRPLFRSADGWIWFASDKGVYIFNPRRQVFSHAIADHISTTQTVVFENYNDHLLIGAQGGEFLKLTDSRGQVIKDFSDRRRKEAAALCIVRRGETAVWMSTSDGIFHTDLAGNSRQWFYHRDGDTNSLPRDFIASLFFDSKKNCWVFPWREGIWQMDTVTGKCHKLFDGFIDQPGGIKKLLISNAVEDASGNIWMADLDEGIILFDAGTHRFSKPFEKQIGALAHTARVFIRGDWIWSALPWAILKWNVHDRRLLTYSLPAAINKSIYDFYPDQQGNWWLATAGGLVLFDEKEVSFRKFTNTDGLYENDVNANLFCTADGRMVIGNPKYTSYFDPQLLRLSSTGHYNVALSEFIASGKMIPWNSGTTISLQHTQNNIVIRWTLPAYANPLKNRYYYQLKGFDSTWRYAGNIGEIQYANLSPGHYTVFLRATTANETAADNIITLKFIIEPPFWKRWWFISLAVLCISALFFAVVRYISQRNLKEKLLRLEKEQAIEKERNRISRDMHDDLGSGLTKIAILSEVVKKQIHEPEKAKGQLENISASSRELVDNLQDIIWVLNPKNDTLENLAAYIREYALKFFEPFGTHIHFDYPASFGERRLSEETRRNIFLVMKESFNNIAKHAWCNNVTIGISETNNTILISVTDDGKGFDKEKSRQFGNGLINMKNRIEQIGGRYAIEPSLGAGTRTSIELPLS